MIAPWPADSIRTLHLAHGAGPVERPAIAAHRVVVHLSDATPTRCRETALPFVRRHGTIDLTPAREVGGFDADTPSASLELRLSEGLLQRVAADLDLPPAACGLQTRHLLRDPQLLHLALALHAAQEDEAHDGAEPLYVQSLGVAAAARLLGPYRAPAPAAPTLSAHQLQRVLDHIATHLDEPLTLDRLARIAGLSATRLQRAFRAAHGVPLHRYVVQRRVAHARTLLLRRDLPAAEIALAAGFAHQSHMARWMRRLLGTTPAELRRDKA